MEQKKNKRKQLKKPSKSVKQRAWQKLVLSTMAAKEAMKTTTE